MHRHSPKHLASMAVSCVCMPFSHAQQKRTNKNKMLLRCYGETYPDNGHDQQSVNYNTRLRPGWILWTCCQLVMSCAWYG